MKKNNTPLDDGATDSDESSHPKISRRKILKGAAATAGLLALGSVEGVAGSVNAASMSALSSPSSSLPAPALSGIEHIIVVMMENRSFDHYLGWLPGADGKQAGLTYTNKLGAARSTYQLTDYQNCAHPDPDHSQEGGLVQLNNGACDGWLRSGDNDEFAIGYYTAKDLPFYRQALRQCTTFDRYFCSIMAETYPNRFFQHSAQTDRIHNSPTVSTLPTIWDSLAAKNLTGRYYYGDVPFLALWGSKYINISRPFENFITDCAQGTLPQVAYVDPVFSGETQGTSKDDHPHADIRDGQAFLHQVYKAVTNSPQWSKTVLVINYDEWGGFFDHVPPPVARDAQGTPISFKVPDGTDSGLLGFRVPCLLFSPLARAGRISHNVYDHTSILKMIEWRWNLPPLTARDREASNLAESLDFHRPANLTPFDFTVPPGPFGTPCLPGVAPPSLLNHTEEWEAIRALAVQHGWPL